MQFPIQEPNKTNKDFIYSAIVVASAVIIGGGVLAYQYWFVPEVPTISPQPTIPSTPEPTPTQEPVSTSDETADWKTYRNEKYGFEVKYPTEYEIMQKEISELTQGKILTSFGINKTNILDIAVYGDRFENYRLFDNPGGFIFRFVPLTKLWVHNEDGSTSQFVPKRIDALVEAYAKSSGDINCSWDWLIIPHPSYSYLVEIVNKTCSELYDVGGGILDYKKPDFVLDAEKLLSTFRFLK